mgnify:CR=1 FL=1
MGLVRSVKSFLGKNLITKEKLNDPELSKARLDICSTCPFNKNGECRLCGCVIEIKVDSKVNINVNHLHFEETHCPKGSWPIRLTGGEIGGNDLEIANHYREMNGKNKIRE